ncbi:MAG: hypothetical protein QOF71_715 [Candidatus Eremiobacteraeota bacterium]|jgi:plastocyanin|nr:hypothetical protein [Candidatus Eremiobacteraeota bacterium]
MFVLHVYGHVGFSRRCVRRNDACKGEILVPFSWVIDINTKSATSATVTPNPLNVSVGDEIVWANNDGRAHWPALANGTLNTTFFMPNQIAPNSSSSSFRPGDAETFNYVCSLHPHDTHEQGTIKVS